MDFGEWPGPGFAKGSSKVTVTGRATVPKVSFLEPPRTHTFGQERSVCKREGGRSKFASSGCRRQSAGTRG